MSMLGSNKTPILLLKTKSTPTDGYEDYFKALSQPTTFHPTFVRVFEHSFVKESLQWLRTSIENSSLATSGETSRSTSLGGIIFTSQRAVDAFAEVIVSVSSDDLPRLLPPELQLFVVGPATAKAVRALGLSCQVVGEASGNGETLAEFMLEHYRGHAADGKRLPLLFLVGEQRRDIIPKKLQSADLPEDRRIEVMEKTVYETREKADFADEFRGLLQMRVTSEARAWVVVFSPTGCEAMLRTLGWLDGSGRYSATLANEHNPRVRIATIGPTTRDHLVNEYAYHPDVCAERPSPEGVGEGIKRFYDRNG